ncbi:unnamed protein product [Paramecium sonneborni]|uniref:Uncharacterized protein n=1 Tax=Paramecium sonneborni TaxID=65129 RepID=A0A8S1RMB3_9CILI|nr:unnamed protein product [Paramecium sonneborni]
MTHNEQEQPNMQNILQAFAQCNLACKDIEDQRIKGILMNTNDGMVQVLFFSQANFKHSMTQ